MDTDQQEMNTTAKLRDAVKSKLNVRIITIQKHFTYESLIREGYKI